MGKITFILGGARSGKSTYALSLARKYRHVAFIATCEGKDREMRQRIKKHKETRPSHWQTFEEPRELTALLGKMGNSFDCILIDCLTLLVSNLLLAKHKEAEIIQRIELMLAGLKKKKARVILVANEVGLGIVPRSKLGREFRDIAGKVNQAAAKEAEEVFFTVSGIPMRIK